MYYRKDNKKHNIDNLQTIYAIIMALAFGQAISTFFTNPMNNSYYLSKNILYYIPHLLTFICLIIPFYHGMNRYLEYYYIDNYHKYKLKNSLLMIDILFFFSEAFLFFAFAATYKTGAFSFYFIFFIITLDIFWVIITSNKKILIDNRYYYKGKNKIKQKNISSYDLLNPLNNKKIKLWSVINLYYLLIIIICLLILYILQLPYFINVIIIMIVTLLRTICDYYYGWDFYFSI